jgi:hypothetical protein
MLALLMQSGYATVKPYWGCYEMIDAAAPLLAPMVAGLGFGIVYVGWRICVWLYPLDEEEE